VKQRSQTGAKGTKSWDVAKAVYHSAGLRGFYRGFGTTVAREVRFFFIASLTDLTHLTIMINRQIPFTCLQFPMYERLKLILARRRTESGRVQDLAATDAAMCGSLAGGVAAAITTPLDLCKTRIMLSVKLAVRCRLSFRVSRFTLLNDADANSRFLRPTVRHPLILLLLHLQPPPRPYLNHIHLRCPKHYG
jgi:hypothetical protein